MSEHPELLGGLPPICRDTNRPLLAVEQCVRNFLCHHKVQVGANVRHQAMQVARRVWAVDEIKLTLQRVIRSVFGIFKGVVMRGEQGLRAAGIKAACTAVALALVAPAWAACNPNIRLTRPDSRYEAVAGAVPAGSEVRDKVTGLVWQRCVLGMAWSGSTCTGGAIGYTWVQALEAARTAAASSAPGADAWRLPDMKELVSLAETACVGPAINSTWFPAEPGGLAWSSSPDAVRADAAKVVLFSDDGWSVKDRARQVRLVRSGQ